MFPHSFRIPSEVGLLVTGSAYTYCKWFAFRSVLLLAPVLMGAGCKRPPSDPPSLGIEAAPAVSDENLVQARAYYAARCLQCHGPHGHGDGKDAATLRPRPQALSDRMWQSNVSNARIERVLQHGGPAVGKSPVMPAFADLQGQPQLRSALVALLRSFATR